MAWSTREIAELAGTSLRAVRHYHEVGLLAEPERRSNGYKEYGVAHLVRVLRIKRLTDLGFSLAQIAEMGDDDHPAEALRALDAELEASIHRLQRARLELSYILRKSAPTDLPPEFASLAEPEMSDADRALVVVLSRVLGPRGLQTYAEMLKNEPDEPANAEFDNLTVDADESTRQDLAERLFAHNRRLQKAHPDLADAKADAPRGGQFAERTIGLAMRDLYNSAQLDVLKQVADLIKADESS